MPRVPKSPVGLAWVLYKAWTRLPPKQRRQLLSTARTHGPTVAAKAASAGRRIAAARRGHTS